MANPVEMLSNSAAACIKLIVTEKIVNFAACAYSFRKKVHYEQCVCGGGVLVVCMQSAVRILTYVATHRTCQWYKHINDKQVRHSPSSKISLKNYKLTCNWQTHKLRCYVSTCSCMLIGSNSSWWGGMCKHINHNFVNIEPLMTIPTMLLCIMASSNQHCRVADPKSISVRGVLFCEGAQIV